MGVSKQQWAWMTGVAESNASPAIERTRRLFDSGRAWTRAMDIEIDLIETGGRHLRITFSPSPPPHPSNKRRPNSSSQTWNGRFSSRSTTRSIISHHKNTDSELDVTEVSETRFKCLNRSFTFSRASVSSIQREGTDISSIYKSTGNWEDHAVPIYRVVSLIS